MFKKVLAAALVLLTLSACGTEPVAPPLPAERLALPFDRYRPDFAQQSEITRARTTLVRACLHGVVELPAQDAAPGVLDRSPNLRRYGVIDEASATGYGYHFPRTQAEKDGQTERLRWSAGLTDAQQATLAHCTDQAETTLTKVDDGFLTDADFRSLRTAQADPRVGAAFAAWRACMAEQGYSYQDPPAAISDRRWNLDSALIPDAEKETALADVRCKAEVHLVETWHDVDAAVQEARIRQDAARFDRLATAVRTQLAAARRVLGSS
ncbi:hypothetical protein M8542_40740 [Amycolatopsis sp. OK19-0408]|uniref:Lipoprotein n=1 Tax=Amycolatopsis iheyensis TaxID=2945988 RepID=A0A9X2NLU1_9PSEU|nr:hypothetical protein [Amycolatopsis iheyensis]MCR6489170.1 hypothetical protein [Amycolatopsis iheyensis]